MTINRRWIAREWLFLLAGFVWAYVLSPIVVPLLARLVFWLWFRLHSPGPNVAWSVRVFLGPDSLIAVGPYVIFQLVRMTMWAIRTVREPK